MNQAVFRALPIVGDTQPKTITLSSEDIHETVRLLARLLGTNSFSSPAAARAAADAYLNREALVHLARQLIKQRSKRTEHFGAGMFGEPGWDMLLFIYAEEGRRRITVSNLCKWSGVHLTTGIRWLDYLESQHLVRRTRNPIDGRQTIVEMTDKGRTALDSYFRETLIVDL